jgi:hypothetical protein
MTEAEQKKPPRRRMPARRRVLWALVVANLLGIPALIGLPSQCERDDPLETAINDLGFYPTRPPTRLRRPGSLFLVRVDGTIIRTVCEANEVNAIRESDSTTVAARLQRNAGYALDGRVVDQINARLDAQLVQAVRYELSDVKVLEIAGNRLVSIAERMKSDPDCEKAIGVLVRSREFVCQGVSVLLASAKYTVEIDSRRSANGEISTDNLNAITDVLQSATLDGTGDARARDVGGASAHSSGSDNEHSLTLVSGEGLDYGVKLDDLCLTPPDATTPRRLPRNVVERIIYKAWQLSPI